MKIRTGGIMVFLCAVAILAAISMGCAKKAPESSQQLIQDGLKAFKNGEYEKALDKFTEAEKVNPKDAEAHFFRGNALSLLGNKQEAIEEFNKSIQLAPNVPEPYYNIGNAYASLGKYQESVNAYDKAIERDPTYGRAYYNKAMVLSRMGRAKEAEETLAKGRAIAGELPAQPGQQAVPPEGAVPGKQSK